MSTDRQGKEIRLKRDKIWKILKTMNIHFMLKMFDNEGKLEKI